MPNVAYTGTQYLGTWYGFLQKQHLPAAYFKKGNAGKLSFEVTAERKTNPFFARMKEINGKLVICGISALIQGLIRIKWSGLRVLYPWDEKREEE